MFRLCYVELPWCYFTSQEIDKQWGDDWNDAPYEHNAGNPYTPCWHREGGKLCDCEICKRDWNDDGTPKWEIVKLTIESDFEQPCDFLPNTPSVQVINSGAIAWLRNGKTNIFAGITIEDFQNVIMSFGGKVYRAA